MEEWLYRISCPWRLIGLCVAQPWRSILWHRLRGLFGRARLRRKPFSSNVLHPSEYFRPGIFSRPFITLLFQNASSEHEREIRGLTTGAKAMKESLPLYVLEAARPCGGFQYGPQASLLARARSEGRARPDHFSGGGGPARGWQPLQSWLVRAGASTGDVTISSLAIAS